MAVIVVITIKGHMRYYTCYHYMIVYGCCQRRISRIGVLFVAMLYVCMAPVCICMHLSHGLAYDVHK